MEKPRDTKIITQFSQEFNIDDLFKDESELFNSIDDTKIVVDGIEIKSSKPTITSFESLEKEEEEEEKMEPEGIYDYFPSINVENINIF